MRVDTVVNGRSVSAYVAPRQTLADWLREDLCLKGTHLACEHGVCGSCTLLVDGEAVRSCLMLAVQATGHEITTVEALVSDTRLHSLLEGFRQNSSFQCGYCTAGFIATCAAALPTLTPETTDEELRELLSGNLCRCTGYSSIVAGLRCALTDCGEADHDDEP